MAKVTVQFTAFVPAAQAAATLERARRLTTPSPSAPLSPRGALIGAPCYDGRITPASMSQSIAAADAALGQLTLTLTLTLIGCRARSTHPDPNLNSNWMPR